MTSNTNPSFQSIRHLESRNRENNNDLTDMLIRQSNGENVDSKEFLNIIEQRMLSHQAMEMQMKLNEKPLKTALNDAK